MNANMNSLDSLDFDTLVPSESKYLSKGDVGEDGVILTIAGFKTVDIQQDGQYETKVVMHFVEPDFKPMILNRTNSQLLAQATGCRTAGEAKGKKILVFTDATVSYGGKVIGGLRLKKVPGAPRQPAAASPQHAQRRPAPAPAREPGSDDGDFNDDPNF